MQLSVQSGSPGCTLVYEGLQSGAVDMWVDQRVIMPLWSQSLPSNPWLIRFWLNATISNKTFTFFFFKMQVQKPKMPSMPSKEITTKQSIKPTEILSFQECSHFIKHCLCQGDIAKPTDVSAMQPKIATVLTQPCL